MTRVKKFFLIVLGFSLILIGVLGLILPILNGTLILLVGIILLSFESSYIEKILLKIVERNELMKKWHKKLDTLLRSWFKN